MLQRLLLPTRVDQVADARVRCVYRVDRLYELADPERENLCLYGAMSLSQSTCMFCIQNCVGIVQCAGSCASRPPSSWGWTT